MNQRATAAFLVLLAGITVTSALASPPGPVVVARASGNALLIWQATPFLATVAAKHELEAQALSEVESAGLQILAAHKGLMRRASSIALKVMYIRTAPQNDPQYAATSFAGFRTLLVLTATKSALAVSSKWPKTLDPKHLPAGITAQVTGTIDI